MGHFGTHRLTQVVGQRKMRPDVPSEASLPAEQIREHRRDRS